MEQQNNKPCFLRASHCESLDRASCGAEQGLQLKHRQTTLNTGLLSSSSPVSAVVIVISFSFLVHTYIYSMYIFILVSLLCFKHTAAHTYIVDQEVFCFSFFFFSFLCAHNIYIYIYPISYIHFSYICVYILIYIHTYIYSSFF